SMSSVQAVKPLTRFTAPFDITGLPAITVPFGKSKSGLPIAVQLVGNVWAEAKVLNAAFALEKAIQSN
ncbi:MAG: amidase, partial [Thermotogae bacterium]